MTLPMKRIESEETRLHAHDPLQSILQREVSYTLTYALGTSGQGREAHAADLSGLITLILTRVPLQGQCKVRIVNTSDYLGGPDSDDRQRHVGEGGYFRDWRGGLVERIEEDGEACGMGDSLNTHYAQELAKVARWNALA